MGECIPETGGAQPRSGWRKLPGSAVAPPVLAVNLAPMAMICQRCGVRPATVHVTEVPVAGSGGHAEAHVCTACCQAVGWSPETAPPPVAELVAGSPVASAQSESAGAAEATCPSCGLTLGEYQQVNLFGCREDYHALGPEILEMVRRWHGAERHVGRCPGESAPAAADTARIDLEARLAAAVADEHYEDAARLRDELRRLD